METGFKDPIKSEVPTKEKKSPWNFDQPHYDERSSCYVNAGSHWGVGKRQPVGHHGNPTEMAATLPQDRRRVKTMKVAEIPRKNLDLDILI